MEEVQKVLKEKYNLSSLLVPIGENEARNNVFEVQVHGVPKYIAKVENISAQKQIRLAQQISLTLNTSNTICSSTFVVNNEGEYITIFDDKILTLQKKEELHFIKITNSEDIVKLGEAIGEFHRNLKESGVKAHRKSDFYRDFMGNYIKEAQNPDRLREIEEFYKKYSPDYNLLSLGLVHNDLNLNNIFLLEDKYFLIDFELLSNAPYISDIGVLTLHLWDFNKGEKDYSEKLAFLLHGYERYNRLSENDKKNIVTFSLRYLYSDENWYTYWSKHVNPDALKFIPEIQQKQNVLYTLLKN